jgi:hypothetical protein
VRATSLAVPYDEAGCVVSAEPADGQKRQPRRRGGRLPAADLPLALCIDHDQVILLAPEAKSFGVIESMDPVP